VVTIYYGNHLKLTSVETSSNIN